MFKIKGLNKAGVFKQVERKLRNQGFRFVRTDFDRPWGGFFAIEESQAEPFIRKYFPDQDAAALAQGGKLSPKILIVAPHKRLSWQYHHRRAELWRVINGPVGVIKSADDKQRGMTIHSRKDTITLRQGERHRLVGLDEYGVVAEIWQHTDPAHPSTEEDIVRLQDDFGR